MVSSYCPFTAYIFILEAVLNYDDDEEEFDLLITPF